MKNILYLTIATCFVSINSKVQTIINMSGDNVKYPSGYLETGQYYIKDVNNNLNNFVGTWEYVNGNEKFQIVLTKVLNYHYVSQDYNYYHDGIVLVYKKFLNDSLIFQSPIYSDPNFDTTDGIKLEGWIKDYGRVTKSVYYPQAIGGGLIKQGGEYFAPLCDIEKLPLITGQAPKIKFNLYLRESMWGETNNDIYDGLPLFSIPNNIIMTKI